MAVYARVTRVQGPPERVEDMIAAFTGTALPAIRALHGYAGHSLGVNRGNGDGQAVTFWESREALEATEPSANDIRAGVTQAGGASVVSVDRFETLIMDRTVRASAPAYIRVSRGQADPGRLDDMARIMRDEALPVLRLLPGFRAAVVGADRASGRFAVTTVWNSPEERDSSLGSIDAIRRRTFEAAGAGDAEMLLYEVTSVEFVGAGVATG
jgi:heme-degrading monooxygenase HmoA